MEELVGQEQNQTYISLLDAALGITIIITGDGVGDPSSNLRRSSLQGLWEKLEFVYSPCYG